MPATTFLQSDTYIGQMELADLALIVLRCDPVTTKHLAHAVELAADGEQDLRDELESMTADLQSSRRRVDELVRDAGTETEKRDAKMNTTRVFVGAVRAALDYMDDEPREAYRMISTAIDAFDADATPTIRGT